MSSYAGQIRFSVTEKHYLFVVFRAWRSSASPLSPLTPASRSWWSATCRGIFSRSLLLNAACYLRSRSSNLFLPFCRCSGSEALLYHLSEVKGMSLWKQKFEPLGLDSAAIEGTTLLTCMISKNKMALLWTSTSTCVLCFQTLSQLWAHSLWKPMNSCSELIFLKLISFYYEQSSLFFCVCCVSVCIESLLLFCHLGWLTRVWRTLRHFFGGCM